MKEGSDINLFKKKESEKELQGNKLEDEAQINQFQTMNAETAVYLPKTEKKKSSSFFGKIGQAVGKKEPVEELETHQKQKIKGFYRASKADSLDTPSDHMTKVQMDMLNEMCTKEMGMPYATKEFKGVLSSIQNYIGCEKYESQQKALVTATAHIQKYLDNHSNPTSDRELELLERIKSYSMYFDVSTNGSLRGYEHREGEKEKNPNLGVTNVWKDVSEYKLFPHEPKAADVHQRFTEDCYMLSALSALAYHSPQAIKDSMRDNGDGTVTVRFYDSDQVRRFGQATTLEKLGSSYGSSGAEEKMQLRKELLTKIFSQFSSGEQDGFIKTYLSSKEPKSTTAKKGSDSLLGDMDADFDELLAEDVKQEKVSQGSLSDDMDTDLDELLAEDVKQEKVSQGSLSDDMDTDLDELLAEEVKQENVSLNSQSAEKQKETVPVQEQPNYRISVEAMKKILSSNSKEWYDTLGEALLSGDSIFAEDLNAMLENMLLEKEGNDTQRMEAFMTKFLDDTIQNTERMDKLRSLSRTTPDKQVRLPIYVTVSKQISTLAGGIETNAADSLWVQMIEKAYAIQYGNGRAYEGISLGNSDVFLERFCNEDFKTRDILAPVTRQSVPIEMGNKQISAAVISRVIQKTTHDLPEHLPTIEDLLEELKKDPAYAQINKEETEQISHELEQKYHFQHRLFSGKYTQEALEEFQRLDALTKQKEVVTVGADVENAERKSYLKDTGIRPGHAYAVLQCFTHGGHNFVTLRDPYALFKREYVKNVNDKGDVSYEKVNASNVGLSANNSNGIFHMEFNDFLTTFNKYSGIRK